MHQIFKLGSVVKSCSSFTVQAIIQDILGSCSNVIYVIIGKRVVLIEESIVQIHYFYTNFLLAFSTDLSVTIGSHSSWAELKKTCFQTLKGQTSQLIFKSCHSHWQTGENWFIMGPIFQGYWISNTYEKVSAWHLC